MKDKKKWALAVLTAVMLAAGPGVRMRAGAETATETGVPAEDVLMEGMVQEDISYIDSQTIPAGGYFSDGWKRGSSAGRCCTGNRRWRPNLCGEGFVGGLSAAGRECYGEAAGGCTA